MSAFMPAVNAFMQAVKAFMQAINAFMQAVNAFMQAASSLQVSSVGSLPLAKNALPSIQLMIAAGNVWFILATQRISALTMQRLPTHERVETACMNTLTAGGMNTFTARMSA